MAHAHLASRQRSNSDWRGRLEQAPQSKLTQRLLLNRSAGCEEGRMDATAEPSRHLTLLQFRRVIPSSAWLRASILWADDLAAIWPMREPEPLNRAQEQPLQEVWSLLNAGYFQRCEALDCS